MLKIDEATIREIEKQKKILAKTQRDYDMQRTALAQAKQELAQLKQQTDKPKADRILGERQRELEEKIETLNNEIANLKTQMQRIGGKIGSLQRPRRRARAVRVASIAAERAKMDSARKELAILRKLKASLWEENRPKRPIAKIQKLLLQRIAQGVKQNLLSKESLDTKPKKNPKLADLQDLAARYEKALNRTAKQASHLATRQIRTDTGHSELLAKLRDLQQMSSLRKIVDFLYKHTSKDLPVAEVWDMLAKLSPVRDAWQRVRDISPTVPTLEEKITTIRRENLTRPKGKRITPFAFVTRLESNHEAQAARRNARRQPVLAELGDEGEPLPAPLPQNSPKHWLTQLHNHLELKELGSDPRNIDHTLAICQKLTELAKKSWPFRPQIHRAVREAHDYWENASKRWKKKDDAFKEKLDKLYQLFWSKD